MKVTLMIEKEFDIKTLQVKAGIRYWANATVNGVEDANGDLIPCRIGDSWCPKIDIETGIILNWEEGKEADIHYTVCDNGLYTLLDVNNEVVLSKESYVPKILCPAKDGDGDYIILSVNKRGVIADWKPDVQSVIDIYGF